MKGEKGIPPKSNLDSFLDSPKLEDWLCKNGWSRIAGGERNGRYNRGSVDERFVYSPNNAIYVETMSDFLLRMEASPVVEDTTQQGRRRYAYTFEIKRNLGPGPFTDELLLTVEADEEGGIIRGPLYERRPIYIERSKGGVIRKDEEREADRQEVNRALKETQTQTEVIWDDGGRLTIKPLKLLTRLLRER